METNTPEGEWAKPIETAEAHFMRMGREHYEIYQNAMNAVIGRQSSLLHSEREKDDMTVSWDIAEGGTEWVVQFWRGRELLTQLDKNADSGGNFKISSLRDKLSTL